MTTNQKEKVNLQYLEWRENNIFDSIPKPDEGKIYSAFLAGYSNGIREAQQIVKEHFDEVRA